MARHYSRSPSRERPREEEEDSHTPLVSHPTPSYQYLPHQGQQFTPPTTVRSITSPRSLTERTPLLPLPSFPTACYMRHKWVARAKLTVDEAVRAIPAVILGLLVNILDGISCTSFDAYSLSNPPTFIT
jgi:hypothetical protein